jgi:hypothetical protein
LWIGGGTLWSDSLKHIVGTEQTPGGAKESFNVVTIHPARQDHPKPRALSDADKFRHFSDALA